MNADVVAKLREDFKAELVGKLPKITCRDCSDSPGKACKDHRKSKCAECRNFITSAHIHIDYVGHAETTDRLLDADPEWNWEPVAWHPDGMPLISTRGNTSVMWIWLSVSGVRRLGVGTADARKPEVEKELIGDALRNAAMRFGVALVLWARSELAHPAAEESGTVEEPPAAAGPEPGQPAEEPAGEAEWRPLVDAMNAVEDKEARIKVKADFGNTFGAPNELTRAQIPKATEWLAKRAVSPAATKESPESAPVPPAGAAPAADDGERIGELAVELCGWLDAMTDGDRRGFAAWCQLNDMPAEPDGWADEQVVKAHAYLSLKNPAA